MANFSGRSLDNLHTCENILQEICHEAIKIKDFSVICGHRNEADQNKAFAEGKSKAKWGQSKHNFVPSRAVDIAPYPVNWEDKLAFAELAGIIKGIAHMRGYKIRWGGDFKGFYDGVHFEIIGE